MLMSGFTLAVVGFNLITGVSAADDTMRAEMDVPALLGVACVVLMIALHVWGAASLKTYIVLIVLGRGLRRGLRARHGADIGDPAFGRKPGPLSGRAVPVGRHSRST